MTKKRKAKFVVEFELPDKVSVATAQEYVHDAVAVMSAADENSYPIGLGINPTVKRYRKPRTNLNG